MNNSEHTEISVLSYFEIRKYLVHIKYNTHSGIGPVEIIRDMLVHTIPELKERKILVHYLDKTPMCTILEILGKDATNMECLYVNCYGEGVFSDPRITEIYNYIDIKTHGYSIQQHTFLPDESFEDVKMFLHEYYHGKYDHIISEYSGLCFHKYIR